jgi:cytochrome c peroxidase
VFREADGLGLTVTYAQLIQEAFDVAWWDAPAWTTCGQGTERTALPRGENQDGQECFNLMEANFSLFWGLAIQAYERTLLSGQTRFDTFLQEVLTSGTSDVLTPAELRGLHLFVTDGNCIECHLGAALTSASVAQIDAVGVIRRAATAFSDTLGPAIQDEGFFNIGVQHRGDHGLGRRAEPAEHPDGPPLSFSAQYVEDIAERDFARDGVSGIGGRALLPDPCRFAEPLTEADLPGFEIARCLDNAMALNPEFGKDDLSGLRVAVDGAFKVPGLRNVEFTGPYMHNGGMATLEQVIRFYNRGGDVVGDPDLADSVEPLNLTEGQQAELVAFLRALTDERVLFRQAPFDHPELFIAHGHGGDERMLDCMAATRTPALGPDDEERAIGFRLNSCEHIEQIFAVGRDGSAEALRPFAAILKEGL